MVRRSLRVIVSAVFVLLLVTSAAGASTGCPEATLLTVTARVVNVEDKPLPEARVYIYAGPDRVLIGQGTTGDDGTFSCGIVSPGRFADGSGRIIDLVVRAHDAARGLLVSTWSEPLDRGPGSQAQSCTMTLKYKGEHEATSNVACSSGSLDYAGSGTFREIRVGYTNYVDPIAIAEMHSLSGSLVKATYTTSVKSSVQAGYKQTYPTPGVSWSVSGSITKYMSTSDTWSSGGSALAKRLNTYFNCRQEEWEYQEEDGDIPGVWHTLQAWKEIFIVSHNGSAVWGSNVSTACDNYPYANVVAGMYGSFRAVGPQCTSTASSSGSVTYSAAWSRNGFSASSTNTYSSALTWEFKNTRAIGGNDFAWYDRNTGKIWNVTSE